MTGLTVASVIGAVIIGLVATVVMNLPMRRLHAGDMPPAVAAGVLTNTHPEYAPARLAATIHYVAGGGTGLLYLLVVQVFTVTVPGPQLIGTILAAVVVFGLMVGFFILVPLPRAGELPDRQLKQIKRSWGISTGVYVAVVAILQLLLL